MKTVPRIITDFSTIDERDWARLDHGDNPFLSYAFLNALEASTSISADSGWQPHHLGLYQGDDLVAFAPTYIKFHSHGEFVFDWAWASAYQRHGLPYYPKLLTAIPYSPVTGTRLLVKTGHPEAGLLRQALVDLAIGECNTRNLSTWHCNFCSDTDAAALDNEPLLARRDWQYHWFNQDYQCFDDFLSQLRSRKRKNIRRERRRVSESGIRFEWKCGTELSQRDHEFVYACYQSTFMAYGNHPALQAGFFRDIAKNMPGRVHVLLAMRDDQAIAMSFFLSGGGRLYGRYWGCMEEVPGLHFEAAYYQGIEYCITHGIRVFESGAQGQHKISRGFVPSQTRSFHLVRNEAFREAIAQYLTRENQGLDEYREQLAAHDPFRRDSG
ncbi:MAG: GNAT family N-acetyltransferase [Xanthomonadales bacterium]